MTEADALPTKLSLPLFGAIAGLSREAAYGFAAKNSASVVRAPGRRLSVPVAVVEQVLGRAITAYDLALGLRRLEGRSISTSRKRPNRAGGCGSQGSDQA